MAIPSFTFQVSEDPDAAERLTIVSEPTFDPSSLTALDKYYIRLVNGRLVNGQSRPVLGFIVFNEVQDANNVLRNVIHLRDGSLKFLRQYAPDDIYAILQKQTIPNLPDLKCIELNSQIPDDMMAKFLNTFAKPTSVTHFLVSYMFEDKPLLFHELGRFRMLQRLIIRGNNDPSLGPLPCYSKKAMENLGISVEAMPNLRTLYLHAWIFLEDPLVGLGPLLCSNWFKLKTNDVPFFVQLSTRGHQFTGDINNIKHFRNLEHFSERTIDFEYFNRSMQEGPTFSLAMERAKRLGNISADGQRNCNLNDWLNKMSTMHDCCRKEDQFQIFHFFVSQIQPNHDTLKSLFRLSSVILIQKHIRRYLAQRRMYQQACKEEEEAQRLLLRSKRRMVWVPKSFYRTGSDSKKE